MIFRLNRELIDAYEDTAAIDYPKVLGWVKRSIDKNLPHFARILLDGQLAGFYCLTESNSKRELDSFFVLPPFQGRGIGTQVLKHILAQGPVFLYVFRRNIRAVALYQRLGFRIREEVGTTRYIMEFPTPDR